MLHRFIPSLAELWLSLATILILQGIALYTWQFRREPGARWQSYVQVCKGAWLFSILMIAQSDGAGQRNAWHALYTLLALSVCYFWLRCIAEISGAERKFARWFLPATRGLLGFFFLCVFTNGWHHTYWRSIQVTDGVAHVQTGPLGYLALLYGYGLIAYSIWINIVWALRCKGLRRRQAWMFVLPTLAAWTGQFLAYLPHPRELEPHTIGFLSAGLLMAWAFLRWRAYSILPLAEKTLVQTMADGYLVVDESGNVVALNEQAKAILADDGVAVGTPVEAVYANWPELLTLRADKNAPPPPQEAKRAGRVLQISLTPLRMRDGQLLGQALLFKDVTRERLQQERIVEQQKSLAMLQERERLGRELHDGPGQMWSFLAVQTQAARLLLARAKYEQADQTLEQIQQIIQEVHAGLRESIASLQTSFTGDLIASLEAQLCWSREYCALQTEMALETEWREETLSPAVQAQTLRILQEALANVRKSAQASRVCVRIARRDAQLVFSVEDDGCGFDVGRAAGQSGRHGLNIMRERAREIGAELRIESAPGAGATITLTLPAARGADTSERDLS